VTQTAVSNIPNTIFATAMPVILFSTVPSLLHFTKLSVNTNEVIAPAKTNGNIGMESTSKTAHTIAVIPCSKEPPSLFFSIPVIEHIKRVSTPTSTIACNANNIHSNIVASLYL
jgi:hypothetical protein